MMQPQIILLKEGTDSSQGVPQIVSNINACSAVADAVRTTLGPRGMDKLIVDSGGKATISNDGATILKTLDIVHPAAKTLVDIAKSQDAEVGDGTTSVVLLAGEFLKQAKPYIEEGVHPQVIIRAFRRATALAVDKVREMAVKIKKDDKKEQRSMLLKCAATTLSSKLVSHQKDFFSKMVVDAVSMLDELLPLNMIGIKKITGGALEDSKLVDGVAFKKTFSYAGFEMQRKQYENTKIAMLNVELELKAEKENAEIRVDNVQDYQAIVDAEWKILYDKLDKIHKSGAKVVLSKLPIGDVATQYFADRDMFCAGRVVEEDLKRTMKACGGSIQTSVGNLTNDVLGSCALFEEIQVGGERYNLFTGCPQAKTCTLLLRGGAEQFIEETERSLHDAIMIVRRAMKNDSVVAGGGAIEMEISKYLRDYSRTIAGKEQLIIGAFAKALEIIPRQLCENAGFDATNILNKLRQSHAQGGRWFGVDILTEDIADNFETFVWEPAVVKINALTAASEATCLILSVDETIKNPKSGGEGGPQAGAVVALCRYNLFTGCPQAKTCTLLLGGGAEQFIEETERSLRDAIMIVRRAMKNDSVVAGGGAIEMEISKYLRDYSRTIAGKEQLIIGAFAKALEIIPRQLCENAGFDATNILNKLRQSHAQGGRWFGVDILTEDIADNFETFVWEPAVVKINALTAASEATCLILSVDETIKNPKSGGEGGPPGRGRGRPM